MWANIVQADNRREQDSVPPATKPFVDFDVLPVGADTNGQLRRTMTNLSSDSTREDSPALSSRPPGQRLRPCHLSLHTFGSRFIPHSTSEIKCILPFMNDRYVLLGTAEGLDLIDMMPSPSIEGSTGEARRRELWRGEGYVL